MSNTSRPKWACPHGCPVTANPCPHLNALLGPQGGLSGSYSTGLDERAGGSPNAEELLIAHEEQTQLEQLFGAEESEEPIPDEDRFRNKLLALNLSERKAALLAARLVRGLTFDEIATELGYANKQSANKQFRDALKQVRRHVKIS